MIPLWKGKNPIYFGLITIIPFDNLYRRVYFVMHTFLVMTMVWFGLWYLMPVSTIFQLYVTISLLVEETGISGKNY
jgi:glycopeptide antibiotics resistance protein